MIHTNAATDIAARRRSETLPSGRCSNGPLHREGARGDPIADVTGLRVMPFKNSGMKRGSLTWGSSPRVGWISGGPGP